MPPAAEWLGTRCPARVLPLISADRAAPVSL